MLESVTVQLGTTDMWDSYSGWSTIITNFDHLIKHPDYAQNNDLSHDIALIFLQDAPQDLLVRPNIASISLPLKPIDLIGKNATIAGEFFFGIFQTFCTNPLL